MSKYTDEQLEHFFQKWLYTYGGATDVISLEQFIKDYDVKLYGDIDEYSDKVCPCVLCLEENHE